MIQLRNKCQTVYFEYFRSSLSPQGGGNENRPVRLSINREEEEEKESEQEEGGRPDLLAGKMAETCLFVFFCCSASKH